MAVNYTTDTFRRNPLSPSDIYKGKIIPADNPNDDKELDSSVKNVILIVEGKIAVEAVEDKIVIQLDPFKSGYECKSCNGTGIGLPCVECSGTGKNRHGSPCKVCEGDPKKFEGKTCVACKGQGTSIVIPETAKSLPTSGRIVSAGPECKKRIIGERVLFGAHTGYFLPFKGNIKLRIMREHEIMCLIHGVDKDIAMGDFMVLEEDGNFRS